MGAVLGRFESRTQYEMHHAKGAWLIGRNCVRACGKLSADVRPAEREAWIDADWACDKHPVAFHVPRQGTRLSFFRAVRTFAPRDRSSDRFSFRRDTEKERKIKQHLVSRARMRLRLLLGACRRARSFNGRRSRAIFSIHCWRVYMENIVMTA